MKTISIIILALGATPVLACTSPETGTLDGVMKQATWTRETGLTGFPLLAPRRQDATVNIALPALNVVGFDCLTWSVELVLPAGVSMRTDNEGNADTRSYTDLAAGETATFDIRLASVHDYEARYEQGWLLVKVRNPNDDLGVVLSRSDGSPFWLYPVVFRFAW